MKKIILLLSVLFVLLYGGKLLSQNSETKTKPEVEASKEQNVNIAQNSHTQYLEYVDFDLLPMRTGLKESYLARGEKSLPSGSFFPIGNDGYAYLNFTGGVIHTEDYQDPVSFVLTCTCIMKAEYIEFESGDIPNYWFSYEKNQFHIWTNQSRFWLGKNTFICHCRDINHMPIKIRVTIEVVDVIELEFPRPEQSINNTENILF